MASQFLFPVVSVETVNFTESLAQFAASAMNSIPGVPPVNSRRYLIRAISVVTKENYGPQFNFFSSAAGNTTDPGTNTFVSRFEFNDSNGQQVGATGLWEYYVDGLAVPYVDADTVNTVNSPTLHVILENLSTTSKSASAAGYSVATFWLEPMSAGWS